VFGKDAFYLKQRMNLAVASKRALQVEASFIKGEIDVCIY
jgi:hypothetical protein